MRSQEPKFLFNLNSLIQIIGILCITLYIWFSSVGSTYKAATYTITDSKKLLEVQNLANSYFFAAALAQIGVVIFIGYLFHMFWTREKKGKKYKELIKLLDKVTLLFLSVIFFLSFMIRNWLVKIIVDWKIKLNVQEFLINRVYFLLFILVVYITIILVIDHIYEKN